MDDTFIATKDGKEQVNCIERLDNVFIHLTSRANGSDYGMYSISHLVTGRLLADLNNIEVARKLARQLDAIIPSYHNNIIRKMAKRTNLKSEYLRLMGLYKLPIRLFDKKKGDMVTLDPLTLEVLEGVGGE